MWWWFVESTSQISFGVHQEFGTCFSCQEERLAHRDVSSHEYRRSCSGKESFPRY